MRNKVIIIEGAQGVVGYIYTLKNLKTGELYVGQTKYPEVRKAQHILNAYSYNRTSKLYLEMRKYEESNFEFEVIECIEAENLDECNKLLDKAERYYIDKFDSFNNGYNSCKGGSSIEGAIFSKVAKRNISEGTKRAMNRLDVQEKISKKVRCIETGEIFNSIKECANKLGLTDAQRKKISAVCKGKRNTVANLRFEYVD